MDICKYISQLRKDKGLSQRELARRAQISNTEISRIESGERVQPSPAVLKKLAPVLGVSSEQLMEAAGYIRLYSPDPKHFSAGSIEEHEYLYPGGLHGTELPILCKEGGGISNYLDLKFLYDIDFVLRVVDNKLACVSIYKGDLALCSRDTEADNTRVLVAESTTGDTRKINLILNESALKGPAENPDDAVTNAEWHIVGKVAAVLRSMEWKSEDHDDTIKWLDLGNTARKMGFTPEQVRWMMNTQAQFLKKIYKK